MGRKRRACTQAIRTAKNPFLGCFFCVFCETLASSASGCSAVRLLQASHRLRRL